MAPPAASAAPSRASMIVWELSVSGEHPAVGFGFQRDAAAGKPIDGVSCTESVERTNQRFLTAWIISAQLTRLETIVRDIAATAARDLHFLQQLRRLLEDQHRLLGVLGAGDCREKSCCTPADNDEVKEHARSL